jgi:2-polyprenyl-6-methoxyphenol hydroxylase-like FAD-dependent oxidoreductase
MFYPIDASGMDAVFAARLDGRTADPREDPREFLERTFAGSGWICPGVIADIHRAGSVYSDALMQIRLPTWHQGRTVLLGDACDCPSLIAGQGSHLAMAGAWLLAEALSRTPGDPSVAFMRYEAALHPYVKEVQRRAAAMTRSWLPGTRSRLRLRRFAIRLALQPAFLPIAMRQFRAVPLAHLESRLM